MSRGGNKHIKHKDSGPSNGYQASNGYAHSDAFTADAFTTISTRCYSGATAVYCQPDEDAPVVLDGRFSGGAQNSSNQSMTDLENCGRSGGGWKPLAKEASVGSTSQPHQQVQRRRRYAGAPQHSHWRAHATEDAGILDWTQGESVTAAGDLPQGPGSSIWHEKWNLCLLVLLYMLQGIPMGLALGAMPFMLQSHLSYTQIGTFSLAAYPYSFKLLWSPIVDSLYSARMGRRKTWIIPIQFCTAGLLFFGAQHINTLYQAADVNALTALFLVIVLLAATQDIAVDGWALTLLPPEHVSWAATCQTIGNSTGYFTSFTIFLALQDVQFCNTYVRSTWVSQHLLGMAPTSPHALVTLPGYLRFWGLVFAAVTVLLWLFKAEVAATANEEEASWKATIGPGKDQPGAWLSSVAQEVGRAYSALWGVLRLRAVWGLVALLLTYRLSVLVSEGAVSLKMIDKGVPKETLAALVLVQFPVELVSAVFAGRWAAAASPGPPFLASYFMRLAVNAALVAIVAMFPAGATSLALGTGAGRLFAACVALSLVGSAVSTLAFTSLGSLFNRISDPEMGGAYLTLLNTVANMGVILPRAPAFYLIDVLTRVTCLPPAQPTPVAVLASGNTTGVVAAEDLQGLWCPKKQSDLALHSACTAAGGVCVVTRDGFYTVCWTCLAVGLVLGYAYLRYLPKLMALPLSAWRAEGRAPSPASKLLASSSSRID